jgi:hypothetical protein
MQSVVIPPKFWAVDSTEFGLRAVVVKLVVM